MLLEKSIEHCKVNNLVFGDRTLNFTHDAFYPGLNRLLFESVQLRPNNREDSGQASRVSRNKLLPDNCLQNFVLEDCRELTNTLRAEVDLGYFQHNFWRLEANSLARVK